MSITPRGAARVAAIALLGTVATQLFYIAVVSPTDDALLRKITWTSEMALYSLVTVIALVLVARARSPLVWAAVTLAGLVNVIQVGIGLAEFGPAQEANDPKVFASVLGGAFFLYFHGKAMIGMATVGAGMGLARHNQGWRRAFGWLAAAAGLAAAALNLLGMADGMGIVFEAGAAGTAATALFAVVVLLSLDDV